MKCKTLVIYDIFIPDSLHFFKILPGIFIILIRGCRENKAPFELFSLDTLVPIDNYLNYSQVRQLIWIMEHMKMHRIMYKETLRLRRVETTHVTTKQFPHAYASDSLCQSV